MPAPVDGYIQAMARRLMYVECKGGSIAGPGFISWVETTNSQRSFRWRGKVLRRVVGYKYNCVDSESGARYWVSGPKRRGGDRLYSGTVEIDEDALEAYWSGVRGQPSRQDERSYRC